MEQRRETCNMVLEEKMSKNDETVSTEEECDYYMQRCKVLKALNDKYQGDLTAYKTKVQGVDTLTHLLKDSRQENVTLYKKNKSLESAVKNLQRRLSKNGLSTSPSLQDTEVFIPGASKQTLDNLAKENARLRNLLKNGNGQSEKNQTDELDEVKAFNERLESDNKLLKQELETYKQKVADLSKKRDEEKVLIQQDNMQNEANKNEQDSRGEAVMRMSVGCQASNLKTDAVSELSELLKLTVRRCSQLDEQLQQSLEISQIPERSKIGDSNLKTPVLVNEDYEKLKSDLDEAQMNNQRWLMYCQSQSKTIHSLNANIGSLKKNHEMNMGAFSAAHQEETQRFKAAMSSKDTEIQEVRKHTAGLSRENLDLKSQLELYKQQIQACTEDFNTERKDREQAVNKAKALQDANMKLKAELERLKLLNNAEVMSRLQQPVHVHPQSVPQRRYEFVQERGPSGQMMPVNQLGYNVTQPPLSISMPQQAMPATQSLSPHILLDHNSGRLRNNPVPDSGTLQDHRNYESQSLPRQLFNDPNRGSFIEAREEKNLWRNNLSMPTMGRRPGSGQEQLLACPKCNKEFPEKSSADLLTHIDMCNA